MRRAHFRAVFLASTLVLLAPGVFTFRADGAVAAPAEPVAVEVVAAYPGASAEEVERQVTVPLEAHLAGTPGLDHTRSQSRSGESVVRLLFKKDTDPHKARQEVARRLRDAKLPPGVSPRVSPEVTRVLLRYTLRRPRDEAGRPFYNLNDLRCLQNDVLGREFRRALRIAGVASHGGTVKRYEVRPDPDRLRRYGVTLGQLATALDKGAAKVGGGDPLAEALKKKDARAASAHLRAEEARRLREVRSLLIAEVNRVSVHVEDVVEGGRLAKDGVVGLRGVVVSHGRRQEQVGRSRSHTDGRGRVAWDDEDDVVEGAILLRPGADEQAALKQVQARIKELNEKSGRILPGVRIEPYHEGTAGADHTWLQANLPADVSPGEAARLARKVRERLRRHAEVKSVVSCVGGFGDGPGPTRAGRVQFFVALTPRKELLRALREELGAKFPGVDWWFSATRRDTFAEAFEAAPGEGVLKVFGPDLDRLRLLASQAKAVLAKLPDVDRVRVVSLAAPRRLAFRIDLAKCKRWGVGVADVNNVVQVALDGKTVTQMVEGEKRIAVVLRWPRRDVETILDLPVDVPGPPPKVGKPFDAAPRVRLRDFLTPLGKDGKPDPKGQFLRPGVGVIYREDGKRMVAVRWGVRDGKRVAVRAEAKKKTAHLFRAPYLADWGGE